MKSQLKRYAWKNNIYKYFIFRVTRQEAMLKEKQDKIDTESSEKVKMVSE